MTLEGLFVSRSMKDSLITYYTSQTGVQQESWGQLQLDRNTLTLREEIELPPNHQPWAEAGIIAAMGANRGPAVYWTHTDGGGREGVEMG